MAEFGALIFDCDGVLVDSEVIAIACEARDPGRMGPAL
jgi:beta-phosphoglucomutase-like phosphatase (HAD superfamily)